MRSHSSNRPGLLTVACSLAAALFSLGSLQAVGAQAAPMDARWHPWVGCWEAAEASGMRVVGSASAPIVCATPAMGTSGLDVVTVAGGKVLGRIHLDGSGERRATSKDGCTGWESETWSKSGSRVYVRSESSCPGGLVRSTNGLIALTPRGEWLDIQNVATGTNKALRVIRMMPATNLSAVPADVASALAVSTFPVISSRLAAGAALTGDDLLEAAKHVDASVEEAWLVERDQGFTLDGKKLASLADAGLPPGVIDVMVALTYPKVFALNPETGEGEFRPAEGGANYGGPGRRVTVMGYDPLGYPMFGYGNGSRCYDSYYDPYSYGNSSYSGFSGCGYGAYGSRGYGYGGYGYGGFGYGGLGSGYYPYGYGYGPIVVVKGGDAREHGRLIKGKGYTSGSSGASGSTSGSSSGTGSTTPASSSKSPPPAPPRTAHPKP